MTTSPAPFKSRLNLFDWGWLAAALLPLVGILPTLSDGVIRAADAPLHMHRIFAMTTLLGEGILWPRWVPWFHLGYGYPVFNFYPPGTFYLGGLLGLLGITAPLAFTLLAALAWVLGSLGTYGLARRFLPASGALLAAMLWAYAPSRLFEVWDQGSLPQMMAAALIPWVFGGLLRCAEQPTRRHTVALALPLAGMIFSHQPITLLTALFVAPGALLLPLWFARGQGMLLRRWLSISAGLALAGGLAAIFLIPLAAELRYVESAQQAPDVIPYLTSNFLQPAQIFMRPLAVDLTDMRFEMPETLGLLGGVLALVGLAALLRHRRWVTLLLILVALGWALFFMLRPSLVVWETIPFMAQLRFPGRLLRFGALFIALAGGATLLWLPRRWHMPALGAALLVTLAAALPLVYPNQAFVQYPNLSALDEVRMEEREYNWGTTSYDEFNPIWGEKPGWDVAIEPETYITDPLRVFVNRLDMIRQYPELQVEELGGMHYRITVASARPVRFRQFYFPGWTATVNGQPAEIYPEEEIGQITLDLPAGTHEVALAYTGTTAQAVGAVVTLVSIGAVVGMLWGWRRSSYPEWQNRTPQPPLQGARGSKTQSGWDEVLPRRSALIIMTAITAFALVNTLLITPNTTWFRYRSDPDTPAYMRSPVQQSFGGVFKLLGYTLDQTEVTPGGLLNVTLFWRAEREFAQGYRPVVQLVNWPVSAAWGSVEPFFPGGGKTDTGYPLDRFASELHSIPVFADAPPYIGRISVQMIDAVTNTPLRLPDGSDRVLLPDVIRIQGATPDLPDRLGYRFADAIDLRCAVVQLEGEQYRIRLGWRAAASIPNDVIVFVHGLNADGTLVAQNDAAPLAGQYPAPSWLPGQTLDDDAHTLPADPAISAVAIGLSDVNGRLRVTRNGQPVPDDRVILTPGENTCAA
ncbi:MAG: hypothetical protein JNJ61_18280 [Anaerolineae bacterium]|nr:hypothetical protein [Anaerolineae bacterium]